MVTHVGKESTSIIDTTLNLPKIPGGKKLTYTQFDMPLTAIDDFEKLGEKQIHCLQNLMQHAKKTVVCGVQRQRKFCLSISG